MQGINQITLQVALAGLEQLGIAHQLVGPPRRITKVCSLLHKQSGGLYYFVGDTPDRFEDLEESVVICNAVAARSTGSYSCIVVDMDPQLAFYKLCAHLFNTRPAPGIHPTAIVHPEALIGEGVHIGAYAVLGRCEIGQDSVIHAHVIIMDGCIIGKRVRIEPNSCIGATGVAWVWDKAGERVVLPQLGGVHIEDDVFLGTDVTVVRGMLNESTFIGMASTIAHGSKIGHSSILGARCHLANNVSIAGSVVLGADCFLGSGCVIRPHAHLAEGTIIGVGAAVIKDISESHTTWAGVPAVAIAKKKDKQRGVPTRPTS